MEKSFLDAEDKGFNKENLFLREWARNGLLSKNAETEYAKGEQNERNL